MSHYHDCPCAECERLDSQPVRRHGIPHAKQATFLGADYTPAQPAQPAMRAQAGWDSLPLFGDGLQPTLF